MEKKMKKVAPRSKEVIIKTSDGTIISGQINLDSEKIAADRVSDLLVKGKNKFLLVYNAEDMKVMGEQVSVVLLNKQHILWVIPDDTK
jgi:non-ribosomal peptide synthetase component E (peptide arylation enzyme)